VRCRPGERKYEEKRVVVLVSLWVEKQHVPFQETPMTTTRFVQGINQGPVLHVALELGLGTWKLAFTVGLGQAPRMRTVTARNTAAVLREVALAKTRFGLADDAPVVSCYEAGRDGFWVHRWLISVGIGNKVIDSSSIEVNRKKRRAKDDGLDADALVRLLVRYELGEKKSFRVVQVPADHQEDQRQLHRELISLKEERTSLVNQIKGHLFGHGLVPPAVNDQFPDWLAQARRWDNSAIPSEMQARLGRLFELWQLVHRQVLTLETEQRRRIRKDETPEVEMVRRLLRLKGIGCCGAWMLVKELFAWRCGFNRKQLGALVGLVPTPYNSGQSRREQGISKAGNKHLRQLLVELAWCWVRHQPTSELAQWFERRFRHSVRLRRIGITAVARKLLIALWRYLSEGEIPAGAVEVDWQEKVNRRKQQRAENVEGTLA
jgi:transposase